MEVVCSREIKTECFETLMDIGRPEHRPDIVAVLKLAQERRGRVSASDISNHLLGGRPESVGERIILRMRDLNLLDENNSLTREAIECLATETAMIPERGVFRVWVSGDSLLPSSLVGIEQVYDSSLKDDILYDGAKGKPSLVKIDSSHIEGSKHTLVIRKEGFPAGTQVTVLKVEKLARRLEDLGSLVKATMRFSSDGVNVLELGDVGSKITLPGPSVMFSDIAGAVESRLRGEWKGDFLDCRDLTAIDSLSRRSFEISGLNIEEVRLRSTDERPLGSFAASISELPIDTSSAPVAREWSRWLLKDEIHGYLTQSEYAALRTEIEKKFKHSPKLDLPSLDVMLAAVLREDNRELFWYLRAPVDLRPPGEQQ